MKTFLYGLVVIAFLVAVGFAFKYSSDPRAGQMEIENPAVAARQLCYEWNSETGGDRMLLSMDLRGEDVIGEFYWLPKDKDSKTGIFKGKATPLNTETMVRTINAIWEAKAEGATVKEELKIIFGDGSANVAWGEMVDRGDGVYAYADPEHLSYQPQLWQTDCGDDAMD